MPLSYSYPGLYIQEVPSNSNAIVPSPTSIAAFVGYSHPFKTPAFNVAQQCFSFNDYVSYFGPLFSSGLVDASLARAVSQFFLNGGSSAWVVGLQPGLFNASGQIIERIGGTSGLAITAATNFVSNAGIFAVVDTTVAPTIASLAPSTVTHGGLPFTLTVTGTNFTPGSKVYWNGADLGTTVFVNAQTLTATVPAADIASVPNPLPTITVVNPASNRTSNGLTLTVVAANGQPSVTSLTPAEAPAGSPTFSLTIKGSDFVQGSAVTWTDSSNHATALSSTFISDALLTATVPNNLVASAGTATVTVTNTPGGTSNTPATETFTIGSASPTPTLSSLSPASASIGLAGFTLTVTGTNFIAASVVEWGATAFKTQFVSPTQLTAQVPTGTLATPGTVQVTVQNGGAAGASGAQTFTINANNLQPTVTGLSPPSGPASGAGFTLTATGTNFTASSVVYWNGVALPTTFVSDTALTANVPASDLTSAGPVSVTVSNPGSTGMVFTALELTDQVPMTVTISGVRNSGQTFDLTITYGSQFESFRNLQLVAPASRLPDQVLNGVSQLVTAAPNTGGYGTSIAAQQLSPNINLPQGPPPSDVFSTCFSSADFLNPLPPVVPVFEPNSALDNLEIFNLLLVPGISDFSVLSAALAFAERKRAFAIVDLPQQAPAFGSSIASPQPAEAWMAGLGSNNGPSLPISPNGAVYYPYLISQDLITSNKIPMAPSGFVAGLYAQTDNNRGVWKAPAGLATVVLNSTGPVLTGVMNDPQQGVLNLDSINCLRTFSGIGTVVWGARTLVAANNALQQWKYVPVRRMTLFIEQTLLANLRWVVFEPNDEPLWIAITASISAFMLSLFKQGGLQGSTPNEAFQVTCDSTTTTPQDQINGVVNIVVAFAPLKPAEFVVINIAQLAGQTAGS
jgi:phage tail sheath protein FI